MLDKLQQLWSQLRDSAWPYFETIWNAFGDHTYLRVAVIAAVSYLIAKLLKKYIPNILRHFSSKTRMGASDELIELFRFPIFYLLFFAGLSFAAQAAELKDSIHFVVMAILKSAMIAVLGIFLYRLSKILLSGIAEKNHDQGIIQQKTLPLFNNTAFVFIFIAASHQIFSVWNVDMTALLASAGIAGIAVGMAAQGTIADIIAGVLILTDNPFTVGDIIHLETDKDNQMRGKVTRIGIRTTRILNEYNVEIIMPNAKLSNSRILNESSSEVKGGVVAVKIKTASGVDIDQLREMFFDVMDNLPDARDDIPKEVHLLSFDWRCATFELVFWAVRSDWDGHMASSLREAAYKRLQKENIPFSLPEIEELTITDLPDSRQEISITDIADSRQEIRVTEMPQSDTNIFVKEVPNLFGIEPVKNSNFNHPYAKENPSGRKNNSGMKYE